MQPIRVLIADDDDDFCTCLAGSILFHPNMELTGIAMNGEEAYRKITLLHPDLILLDNCMPYVDGLAVIERLIEEESEGDYHPIIFIISSWNLDHILGDSIKKRVDYFLRKPIEFDVIATRVFQFLDQRTQASDNQEEKIKQLLHQIGALPKTDGYCYLLQALHLIYKDSTLLKGVTKLLYPEISRHFKVNPKSVERKIQYEIDRIFTRERTDHLEKYLEKANASKGKLTNKQFLASLAQELGYL